MLLPKQGRFYRDKNGESYYSAEQCSFAGCDMLATITVPQLLPTNGITVEGIKHTFVLGELQTFTYSIHTEKWPVRSAASYNPKGFTHGPRNFAGSMIFATFDRHVLRGICDELVKRYTMDCPTPDGTKAHSVVTRRILADELPPFNVTVTFVNEHGNAASLCVYGVEIVDEGQVMSINDMMTETTMAYQARDIIPMERIIRGQTHPIDLASEMVPEEQSLGRAERPSDYYIYGRVTVLGQAPTDIASYEVLVNNGTDTTQAKLDQNGFYFSYCKVRPTGAVLFQNGQALSTLTQGQGHCWNFTL